MHLKKAMITDFYKKSDGMYIVRVRVDVGSGTYIRTLAEEFGKKIGYPASLKSLYRVTINSYSDHNAFHLETGKKSPFHDILSIYSLIKKILCRFFSKQKK